MANANGTADVEAPASPFGRCMRSGRARWRFTIFTALLVAATAWQVAAAGLKTTDWDVFALLSACEAFVAVQLTIWFLPMTAIDERGIRRRSADALAGITLRISQSSNTDGPRGPLFISATAAGFGCTGSRQPLSRG